MSKPVRHVPGTEQRSRRLPRAITYVAAARKLGALDARIVTPGHVFTAAWVRLKCQFGCDGYGRALTCPPHSPSPEETRRVLDEYKRLLIVHCARWTEVDPLVLALERQMFFDGHYKAFAWGSGPCRLCRTCRLEGCVHADRARPSMEAAGIDVFRTARGAGFPIVVVRTREETADYFGLVAVE
jgi:predicted metal-binding protein